MNIYDHSLKVQSDEVDMRLSSAGLKSTLCTASSCPFSSITKLLDTVSNTCCRWLQHTRGLETRVREGIEWRNQAENFTLFGNALGFEWHRR